MSKLALDFTVSQPAVVVRFNVDNDTPGTTFEAILAAVANYTGVQSTRWLDADGREMLVVFEEMALRNPNPREHIHSYLEHVGVQAPE